MVVCMESLPMKERSDDFSNERHAEENNIALTVEFRDATGNYYKAELDLSPRSFLDVVAKNCRVKPFPWQKFTRFTAEEQSKQPANSRKRGTYTPDKSVNSIISSLIEEKITA
jgi:hypothetical protein